MLRRCVLLACVMLGIGCGGVEAEFNVYANQVGVSRMLGITAATSQAGAPPSTGFPQESPLAPAEAWSFVPVAGMKCANGSATGFGINLSTRSNGRLLIYLEGGGGCWDAATCKDSLHIQNANLNGFDAITLQRVMVSGVSDYAPPIPPNYGSMGIWDRASVANPFKDHNYVYIPYCTADFHAGKYPNSPADGLSHVGYENMTAALAYLTGIFTASSTTQVVLSGESAGGFGALWNFPQTQAAFGDIPVVLIASSGPPLPEPYLSASMEEAWREAWGLDGAKSAAAPSTHLFPYLQWVARTYQNRKLDFIEMTGDFAISIALGIPLFGPNSLGKGLFDARQRMQRIAPNVGFFLVPSVAHGCLHQDPGNWPAPSVPYGHANLSLNDWIELHIR